MPPSKKACLAPHAEIKRDDALWAQCKQLGTQEDYDDEGNRADLQLVDCTCGSTLARPVKKNPAPGTRYWVGDTSGDDMKSRRAIELAIADCEADPDRNPVRIFGGVPGRGVPIHSMTIRAHANYPDRYVLEVVNTQHAPAAISSFARPCGANVIPIRSLVAVVGFGRQAPGELSEEETRRRLSNLNMITGLRGWDIFETGNGEWEIQVDEGGLAAAVRDDERVTDDDVAQLEEARAALRGRQGEAGDEQMSVLGQLQYAVGDAIGVPFDEASEDVQVAIAEIIERMEEEGRGIVYLRSDRVSFDTRAMSIYRQIVANRTAGRNTRRPLPLDGAELVARAAIARGMHIDFADLAPAHRAIADQFVTQVANNMAYIGDRPDWGVIRDLSRSAATPDVWERQVQRNAMEAGLRAVDNAGQPYSLQRPPTAWISSRTFGRVPIRYTLPENLTELESAIARALNLATPGGSIFPAGRRFIAAVWEHVVIYQGVRLTQAEPGTSEFARMIVDNAHEVATETRENWEWVESGPLGGDRRPWQIGRNVDRALGMPPEEEIPEEARGIAGAMSQRAESLIAATHAAPVTTPDVRAERLRTIQATRHGELALTPRQRSQRFQEQLHVATPEVPAIPASGTRVAVPGTPARPGTRVQLARTVVHGVEVYPKGAAGEVVQNDRDNLVVKLDDGEFASWTPKYLDYLEGDLEIESEGAARARQLEFDAPRRISKIPGEKDDAEERFKMIELNPALVQNPAWVTNLLAKHFEFLEGKVPAKWLPKLTNTKGARGKMVAAMKEYGTGAYGTVLPTLDPKVVLKLTTDSTEFEFANELAANLTAQVTCEYHLVAGLPEKHQGRDTYLLWRDAADHVGKLGEFLDAHGRDGDAAEALIDRQHLAAQAVYVAFLDGDNARGLIKEWEVTARAMAKIPELAELADGMIINLHEDKVFLSDLHGGNIGLIDGRWLCVDPGNVFVLSS